jgi:hypothetical protein
MKTHKARRSTSYDIYGCGLKGEDGLLGKPGSPGGSFYAKAKDITGNKCLRVNVSGGNGQEGGDSSDGKYVAKVVLSDKEAKNKLRHPDNIINREEY